MRRCKICGARSAMFIVESAFTVSAIVQKAWRLRPALSGVGAADGVAAAFTLGALAVVDVPWSPHAAMLTHAMNSDAGRRRACNRSMADRLA